MHASTSGQNEIWSRLGQIKYILRPPTATIINREDRPGSNRDQYLFAMFYEQECSIYSFSRKTFSNEKCVNDSAPRLMLGWILA